MDPSSALAGTTQINAQCEKCVLTLTIWMNQVKATDAGIGSFKDQVLDLQLAYERLSASLRDSLINEAARCTDLDVGGNLWSQICITLNDCQSTIVAINQFLDNINRTVKKVTSIMKQINESLCGGDLGRQRERVALFITNLTLPLQMINITMHLQQQDLSENYQKNLFLEMTDMSDTVDIMDQRVKHLVRLYGWHPAAGSKDTPVEGSVYQHMERFLQVARDFLSHALSCVRSSAGSPPMVGSNYPEEDDRLLMQPPPLSIRSAGFQPVLQPHPEIDALAGDIDNEIELELTQEFLKNGHSDLVQNELAEAEANFREALKMIRENNFGESFAQTAAEVVSLIVDCCIRQEKSDAAIEFLETLADSKSGSQVSSDMNGSTEAMLSLAACHLLGVVFMRRKDYENAEFRAKQAFGGRRKILKSNHPMTLETVHLLIDIYQAKDDTVKARAYKRFLEPPATNNEKKSLPPTPQPERSSLHQERSQTISPHLETRPKSDTLLYDLEPDPLPPSFLPINGRKKLPWNVPFSRSSKIESLMSTSRRGTFPLASNSLNEVSSRNSSSTFFSRHSSSIYDGRSKSTVDSSVLPTNSPRLSTDDVSGIRKHHSRPSLTSLPSMSSSNLSETALIIPKSRSELAPMFQSIRSLRQSGSTKHAVEAAMRLLKAYEPDRRTLIVRQSELKKNIKDGNQGLAATGHGYAPIHFFCELEEEAATEVALLIENGVDVNAVAFQAGMPGTGPFTPLQRAIERGHTNIVKMLIEANAILGPPVLPKRHRMTQADREALQPLLMACTRGHVEIVHALLEAGSTPEINEFPLRLWHGNSLLHESCWLGDLDMVKMLLDYQYKHQKRRLLSGDNEVAKPRRGKEWTQTVGKPGQQDHFGATPLMYAIDLRDIPNEEMRKSKKKVRLTCLKLLLEHEVHGERNTISYRENVAKMLSLKWNKGPEKGHSIFCYADTQNDAKLTAILDPFRFQCAREDRCSASPKCETKKRSKPLTDKQIQALPHFSELVGDILMPSMETIGTSLLEKEISIGLGTGDGSKRGSGLQKSDSLSSSGGARTESFSVSEADTRTESSTAISAS